MKGLDDASFFSFQYVMKDLGDASLLLRGYDEKSWARLSNSHQSNTLKDFCGLISYPEVD